MNLYSIAIPSLGRSELLKSQTIKTLQHHNIPKSVISIFVIQEEYETYKDTLPDYNIVVGVLGLVKQKEFIEKYYPVNTNILFLDDDIKEIDLDTFSDLDDLITTGFDECNLRGSYIWSIYPVWNKFYRQSKEYLSTSLKICIGGFTGIINRKDNPKVILCNDREDVERSIKYFMRDGIVIRFNKVGYKTNFFNQGGLGLLKDRIDRIEKECDLLNLHYGSFGKLRMKKDYINFDLHKLPSHIPIQIPINPDEFFVLYDMLCCITIPLKNKTNSRREFGKHRCMTFGFVKGRFSGKVGLSLSSQKYPEIYDEIVRIGNLFGFEFTSIHLNHNVICPRHKDSNNNGNSLLVSFGDYTGCNIIIDEKKYDANCNGIIFDGSKLEHYNTDDLVGNKYSLVYYRMS